MKKITSMLLALSLGAVSAQATVNFSLFGGILRTSGGTAIADGGLVLLVASTTDSVFTGPLGTDSTTVGSVFGGDNVIVGAFSTSLANSGFTGGYGASLNLTYSGNITAGDTLQLYWFPTLTTGSATFGMGTSYGVYRTDSVRAGSDIGWVLPSDGSTVSLNFYTNSTGVDTLADSLGNANLTTVPEPATTVALLGGAAGLFVMHRRRQRKTATTALAS